MNKSSEIGPVVVVDLDGTLLRSDTLWETFWSALGRNPFLGAMALLSRRAALKQHLAQASQLDEATLPYDPDVIAFIKAWRDKSGRLPWLPQAIRALPSVWQRISASLTKFTVRMAV